MKPVWCARWRNGILEGWCATESGKGRYADNLRTLCGLVVILPGAIEKRHPTCPECIDKLKAALRQEGKCDS